MPIRFRVGTSVFLFRRYNVIIGIFFVIGVLFILVLMVPSKLNTVDNSISRTHIEKGDLSSLEYRLQKLEAELHRNREVLFLLRKSISGWIKLDPNLKDLDIDSESSTRVVKSIGKRNFVRMSFAECQFCMKPIAQSTENTLDMYRKLEFDNKDGGVWKQGWNIVYDEKQWNKQKKLRIFVVPHSHNDPGWIKTFEKYYSDQTQNILNNMVLKMKNDKRRKFIWAEISFFSLWWQKLDRNSKEIVKKLLASGQLEIVTGGWVMTDEATAHYYAMIEQLVEGHQWLQDNLDYKPKSAWAIDPFGLSPTMAYFLRRMGVDNMVVQRVHYTLKKYLAQHKSLEFLWRQQWDHNNIMDILCHIMPFYSYDIPHTCGPDPKICCQFDFKRLPGNKVNCPWRVPPVPITEKNVADRAWKLLDQYRKKSQLFKSNVVMIQLGDDFRYDKSTEWDQQFNNYQKLFDYINSQEDWHAEAQFGTLNDYFSALRKELNVDDRNVSLSFPSLTGDFFTYADRDDHYWSGYFTSRPFYKNMDRALEAYLRAAEILFSLVLAESEEHVLESVFPYLGTLMTNIVLSRRALSLFQHHDAITGTSRDHVVLDYATKLSSAFQKLRYVIGQCAVFLLATNIYDALDEEISLLQTDEFRNHLSLPSKKSLLFSSDAKARHIILYNSLGHTRKELIKVSVSSSTVQAEDIKGNILPFQILPVFHKNKLVPSEFEIVFLVELPALSLSTFVIRDVAADNIISKYSHIKMYRAPTDDMPSTYPMHIYSLLGEEELYIKSNFATATFSGSTGMLKKFKYQNFASEWIDMDLELKFLKYGTNNKGKDKSGAYLFLPDHKAKEILYNKPQITLIEGELWSEVIVLLKEVEHHFILKNSPGIDGVGFYIYNVVNIASEFNKELIMRFVTSINNTDQSFYTDLNGYQMIRREYFSKLPIQANVYPVTTMAYMEDHSRRFTFLTGHSVGATSLEQGVFDVFLDRRLNQDDNRGLQQGITDNRDTPVHFHVLFEDYEKNIKSSAPYPSLLAHHASLILLHPVFILIRLHPNTDPEFQIRNFVANLQTSYSPVSTEIPCDIHLVNFKTLSTQSAENIFFPTKTIVLNLHRVGFDCRFEMIGNCTHQNGSLSLDLIFPTLFGEDILESSLSLLYTGRMFSRTAFIQIPPMDVITLKLSQR